MKKLLFFLLLPAILSAQVIIVDSTGKSYTIPAGTYRQVTTIEPPVVLPPVVTPTQAPEIVYFNYDDTGEQLTTIRLKIETREGKYYLKDEGIAPYISRYAVNGSVSRISQRELSQQSIPAGEWIHLVKFVSDIETINTDGWKTSTQLSGSSNVKYAASYECTFYIEDGTRPSLKFTQPLWGKTAHRDGLNLTHTPTFSLVGKMYGSESKPAESDDQLRNISWATGSNRYQLLYSAQAGDLAQKMGGKGVTQLNDTELDRAADYLVGMAGASKYFAMDFEPSNPGRDSWKWDYDAGNFRSTMQKLSKKIYDRHGRYFYSWIGKGNRFSFRGKSFELDGYSNNDWGNSLDTYISLHENPAEISGVNLANENITQIGFGYTSITISQDREKGSEWISPNTWYLRALDVLNVQSLITPKNEKLLAFVWPHEDQPMDAKRTPMTRLKLGEGFIKVTDNRVQYAHNLVRDAITVYLCNPKVTYTQYWIFGESYDPYHLLNYSRINGRLSCRSAAMDGFHVAQYNGPDSPPCPANNAPNYISKDALSVSAMVQAHEQFARHMQTVCDGSQVRGELDFLSYNRSGTYYLDVPHKNDTGEFARAYKYNQPWVQVWKNPKTGKKLLLYQDPYAEAFEPCSFRVKIDGKTIERTVRGNDLYHEVI